jgi:hypothetical protein
VLPVALDGNAFQLTDQLSKTSFIRLDAVPEEQWEDELFFQIAVRGLQLLQGRVVAEPGDTKDLQAPVRLFLSHAKADLPRDPDDLPGGKSAGPVHKLLAELSRNPVESWFDTCKISPGARFDEEIQSGVLGSNTLVAVVTDRYSSREWCRREALTAKVAGSPMVVVDALEGKEPRSFPYLGNVPTIRWRDEPGMARRVIILAVGEALRFTHRLESLRTSAGEGDHVLGAPPELLTASSLPPDCRRILYPDPPLGREELEVLRPALGKVRIETPWSRVVGRLDLATPLRIGLSLSTSTDARRYGASSDHLGVVADDLCGLLLLAGAHLAYGGQLGHRVADEEDYVARLFGLVRSFSPQAAEVYQRKLHPVINYAGWPMHLGFGDKEYDQYGVEAELVEVESPEPLGIGSECLAPDARGFFPPGAEDAGQLAARRFAWGRGMTAMREQMTAEIDARVSLGGNSERFVGQLPGVLEEGLLVLDARKPLYLAGALGGATRLLIDGLEGRDRPEFGSEWARSTIPAYDAVSEIYRRNGFPLPTPEEVGTRLAEVGSAGPAQALCNGLDDVQNRELFKSTDPFRIVELILTGLVEVFGSGSSHHSGD